MILNTGNTVNLQATLSASSAAGQTPIQGKHHPITCTDELEYDEAGLRCPHAEVPADDQRTLDCVDHSIAILLIELAVRSL